MLIKYCREIKPLKEKYYNQLCECIKLFHQLYSETKSLTKREKTSLHEILRDRSEELCNWEYVSGIETGAQEIYKQVTGIDFGETARDEWEFFKEGFKKEVEEKFGIELDLSNINGVNDLVNGAQDLLGRVIENNEEVLEELKKKQLKDPKTQSNQVNHESELEELKKKGLSTIYKQLARVFHPDLERDPKVKLEKEEFMKRLSVAYENNDLQALLTLELEWMKGTSSESQQNRMESEEQVKIYNSLVKLYKFLIINC